MAVLEKNGTSRADIVIDDCWNHIGVWGREKPRCPKLDNVIHCMNCDIYSGAGRMLLDRSADAEYLKTWTEQLQEEKNKKYENLVSGVMFRIADEWLALRTNIFHEVVEMREIHRVPHSKTSVLRGLTNIRGELHLCISIGQLLGIEKRSRAGVNTQVGMGVRMIVISNQDDKYVFPVTEVHGICRYNPADLNSVPSTAEQSMSNYLKGIASIENRHVGCLDDELIFPALRRVLG